jgi:hypothetical protein
MQTCKTCKHWVVNHEKDEYRADINEIADRLRELDLIVNTKKHEHLRKWQQERDAESRAKAFEELGIIESQKPEIPESAIKTIAHGMGAIYGTNWSNQDGGWDEEAKQFLERFISLPSVPLIPITTKLYKKRYRGFGRKPHAYILGG